MAVVDLPKRPGASCSRYIKCSDGDIYNVKFRESDQGWRMPINELVASQIASALGVPTPTTALIEVDELFLEANPSVRLAYDAPVEPGLQFGSRYTKPFYEVTSPFFISLASNSADFPKIVIFDATTDNADRCENHYDNVLLVPDPSRSDGFLLFSIDHGACFADYWTDPSTKQAGTWCGSVMPEMLDRVCVDMLFREALSASKILTTQFSEDAVLGLPLEWGLTAIEEILLIRIHSSASFPTTSDPGSQ